MPAWLENLAALGWRVLVVIAFVIVLWYLGTLIWNVVASIGLAILVSIVLAPLVLKLRDGGRSRTSAAGIAWVIAIGLFLGLAVLLFLALFPYVAEVVEQMRSSQAGLEAQLADLGLPAWLNTLVEKAITSIAGLGDDALSSVVGSVANVVGILILATFLLFFFLRDGDKAWLWLFQSLPDEKRELITSAGDEALARVGNYVRGTTAVAAIAAVSSWVFMLILGVPLAGALGLLAFVAAFIPYFGSVVAALIIVLVTYGAVGQTAALVMVGLIAIRYVVVRIYIEPRVNDHTGSLHPVVILVVLPIGFQFAGLAGLILAVPFTAVGWSVARAAIDIIEPESPTNLPETVPGWLDRAAQWSWRGLIVIAFVAGLGIALTTLPLVILPLILALILAATILPLMDALLKRGQSRGMAAALAVGGSSIAIIGVLALALVSLVSQVDELGDTAVSGAQSVDEASGGALGLPVDAVGAGVDLGVGVISDLNSDVIGLAIVVVLSVLLTFYFLRDGSGLWSWLMSHMPTAAADELSAAGKRAFGILGGYMIGTGAISLAGAGSQLVIMWILGLPLALPIFVLSFFGGFIPYIGSLLTTGLALLIAIAVGDTVDIVVMAAWTLVFNIVQGNVVAPLVYNRTTHIHPAIVLAAIPAGSAVAGILGMFLVVPALGVISETWRSVLKVLGSDEYELPSPRPEDTDEDADGDAPDAAEPEAAATAPEPT